jgi:hypothetical protein
MYEGWGAQKFDRRVFPILRDEFGNLYRITHFGPFAQVSGQARPGVAIEPSASLIDVLVFERPIDAARKLSLTLPGTGIGQPGSFRFTLPVQ